MTFPDQKRLNDEKIVNLNATGLLIYLGRAGIILIKGQERSKDIVRVVGGIKDGF